MTFQLASTQLSAASAYQASQANAQEAALIATYADLFTQISNAASSGLTSLNYTILPLGNQAPIVSLLVKYGYKASIINNTLAVDWASPKIVSVITNPITGFNTTNFNGIVKTYLSVEIKPVGGVAPFTFSYSGALPDHCLFTTTTSNALISGMPLVSTEQYNTLTVTVTDSSFPIAQTFIEDFTWNIGPLNDVVDANAYPITGTNITSFNGTTGIVLSANIKPVGGVAPFTFIYSGSLPPNCLFTSTTSSATISGTPLTPSIKYAGLTITITDSASNSFNQDISWSITGNTITNAITALNKTTFTGTTGVLLTVVLKPVGGVAPYSFSYTGNIPNNCTYNKTTTSFTINGSPDTPTAKYAVLTITVTDSNNSTFVQDVDYTIVAGPVTNLSAAPGSSYIGALSLML